MPLLELNTIIHAPPEVCFDLSLDIDLHIKSMEQTQEKAIGGRTAGQIGLGETVTWRAKHFGLYFTMTSRITNLLRPLKFTDEMTKGPFRHLKHQHLFEKIPDGTLMTDLFDFQSPFAIFGTVADQLFLNRYMKKLLENRNELIKNAAENKGQAL